VINFIDHVFLFLIDAYHGAQNTHSPVANIMG